MKIKILFTFFALQLVLVLNAQNTWTQKANFTGIECNGTFGFSSGNNRHIGVCSVTTDYYIDLKN